MMMKKGGGGKPQLCDSKGRYTKEKHEPKQLTKKEKSRLREERRRRIVYERAKNSKDKYLFDVYLALEKAIPGVVVDVNTYRFDYNIMCNREFDIITKKCIIEIKSETSKHCGSQFISQKKYCDNKKLSYLVFAPNISKMRLIAYSKAGIEVHNNINSVIQRIKEIHK